jgi:CRP-like cAMP-binding protein
VTLVDVEEGEVLTREGKPGAELFVIASGSARVTLRGRELATLVPGDAFGEMALLDHGPRAATVTANTAMETYVLGPEEFSELLMDVPQIGRKILKGLAHRLRETEKLQYG